MSLLHSGYLEKQSGGAMLKKWQSRYFELAGHYLKYYKNKETKSDDGLKGTIDVRDISEVTTEGKGGAIAI